MSTDKKLLSLGAIGLLLFAFFAPPIQAATADAIESYKESVKEVMGRDGDIEASDRVLLNGKKAEFGLTDQEAEDVEAQVRLEMTSPVQRSTY